MKVCFYCSYNLSPVGYQKITLDLNTGIQERGAPGMETAKNLLTHSGAKSVFGYDGRVYYLVLKNMRVTNPDIPQDTPGRNWYINCAWVASAEELKELCAVAYYGYTAHEEFVFRLGSCLSPQEEERSYAIETDGVRELAEEASMWYERFLEHGTAEFSSAPCGLRLERLKPALDILRTREITSLYEFVLLEGNVDYFLSSCGCKDPSQLRHYVTIKEEQPGEDRRNTGRSVPEEKSSTAFWALVGGAAVLGSALFIGIGKARKRARSKKKYRCR